MKKAGKIIGILAASLTVAGVIVFLIGMSFLGWDFRRLDVCEYTAKRFEISDEGAVERVELDLVTFPVVVTAGGEAALDYYEATDSEVTVEYADGTLKVREKHNYNPFVTGMFGGLNRNNYKFVLSIPFQYLTITGTNCKVEASDIDFTDLDIKATNLDLTLVNCEASSLKIDATNADIELKDCGITDVSVDATNADVNISGGSYSEVRVDATNNNSDLVGAEIYSIALDGTNGGYLLEETKVSKLTVSATNLNAKIYIAGIRSEYTILTDGRGLPRPQTGTAADKSISLLGLNCDVDLKIGGV